MIIGFGTDLVRVSRLRRVAERFPERIARKIFTPEEVAYCHGKSDPMPSLAARFAAKEAVMKALGTGWAKGVRFVDIEVRRAAGGRPGIHLSGVAANLARQQGIRRWHLSITHDGDVAMATVIAEE